MRRMRHCIAVIEFRARPLALSGRQTNRCGEGRDDVLRADGDLYYVDMIPTLTQEVESCIMQWLVEAREFAMMLKIQIKTRSVCNKGRINNYLSKRGYDLVKRT